MGLARLGAVPAAALILAELKSDTGKLTPAQTVWIELLCACPGIEVYLWRPADFDDVTEILR